MSPVRHGGRKCARDRAQALAIGGLDAVQQRQQVDQQRQARSRRELCEARDLRLGLLEEFDAEQRRETRELRAPLRRFRCQHGGHEGGLNGDAGIFHAAPRTHAMAACCSWLRRLRNTSGGSERPPTRRTPEGIVSASAMLAAAGDSVAADGGHRRLPRATWLRREIRAATQRPVPRCSVGCVAVAPSSGAAVFVASLRRWSLTSVRNFSGDDARVQGLHALFERRMRGEPRRVELAHAASPGCWRRTCARHRRRVRVRAACRRRSPPSR